MRRPFTLLSLALSLVLSAHHALAQKKGKADEREDDRPSASATWTDPVETEKSDKPAATEDGEAKPEATPSRRADPGRKRDKLQLYGQLVIGFGRAPQNGYLRSSSDNTADAPGAKGTVIGFQAGGRYDVTPEISAGLRLPISTASIRQENGKSLGATAFGSPLLFGEYRIGLGRLSTVPIGFGIGIPVAQGTQDRTSNDGDAVTKDYVNRLADATSGWRDSELFQPKRLPVVLSGGVRHERRDFELHADAKFVLLPALSTTVQAPAELDPPNSGTYELNAFALREVTTLGGTYNFFDEPLVYAGLDFSLVWTAIDTFDFEPSQNATRPSSFQAVIEPKVGARFGKVAPSVGYIAPLGGRLGAGDVGGVRLHLDVFL